MAYGCQGKPQAELIEVTCPNCGAPVEMVSTDVVAECEECGHLVISDAMSCALWCDHAKECVGPEIYEKIMNSPDLVKVDLDDFHRFMKH